MEYYFNLFKKSLGDLTDKVPRQVIIKNEPYRFSFHIDWDDEGNCEISMYAEERNILSKEPDEYESIADSDITQNCANKFLWYFETTYYIKDYQWTISLPPM